jgi:predicted acyl esterase
VVDPTGRRPPEVAGGGGRATSGVTVLDEHGVPGHVARVNTFTTAPMDRDREFTGHGVPGQIYELRVELLPLSFLARRGDGIRLEITNQDPLITDAPTTHSYGTKVGTDTYHHDRRHPSTLPLHERPRI